MIISSQSDVNNLTSCEKIDGSITVASSFNGALTLNGVDQIQGSFIAEGVSGLSAIVAPDLEKVQGSITISNLDTLSTITMGALSQVQMGVTITGNPELRTLGFQELEQIDGQLTLTGSFDRYDPSKSCITIILMHGAVFLYPPWIRSKVQQSSQAVAQWPAAP